METVLKKLPRFRSREAFYSAGVHTTAAAENK
jgi:hypothetical protein